MNEQTPVEVTMFMRHPIPGWYSIENVFDVVRQHLPDDIQVELLTLPCPSRRVIPRLRNLWFAWRHRGSVNHITGDVHYLALALPKSRTILTVHDLVGVESLRGIRRSLVVLLWYRLPVWRSRVVTAVSVFTAEALRSLIPRARSKTHVIANPVGSGFFAAGPAVADRTCPALCLGTTINKNLSRIFEACADLGVGLTIVGHLTDEQEAHLRGGRLEFRNLADLTQDELIEVYRESSVLVFPSLYEGFGMPIVEAQALGVPVITSDRQPMRWVARCGALLVDPENSEQIRDAIRHVLSDNELRDRLVAAGRENVQRFRPEHTAEQYAEVYRQVASGSRRSR